eukprot:3815704-Rhodomonas_salina.1
MVHPITIRTIVALAVANGWWTSQGDVKTAYLNADLPKPVYLRPPKGLEPLIGHGKIMQLRKSVYGLGASGRLWWQTFTKKNKELGMESITADDCVFKLTRWKSVLVVAIIVDDILMTGNDEGLRQEYFEFMQQFFKVSDNGDLNFYLGVHYKRDGDDVIANQTGYLERVLKRFGMENCKPAVSPMPQGFSLNPDLLPEQGGYIITLNDAPIVWKSGCLPLVTLSSAE